MTEMSLYRQSNLHRMICPYHYKVNQYINLTIKYVFQFWYVPSMLTKYESLCSYTVCSYKKKRVAS